MAKNKVFLHIGTTPTPGIDPLIGHDELLAQAGLIGAPCPDSVRHFAILEMLEQHRDAGLTRRDVAGNWASITRNWWRGRTDLALSMAEFAEASRDQAALIVDHLAGLELHVVITMDADQPDDLLVARWSRLLKPGRLHVIDLEADATDVDLAETITGVAHVVRHRSQSNPSWAQRLRRKHTA